MKFLLNSTIINPENNEEIKNAIILLHGYGGDGKDISMLTLNWKRFLKNTVFLCPDAHEVCALNPSGYQWFDLNKDDPEYILEENGRNTAAAVFFAALASNPDDILCIMPSDHWINDDSYYCKRS